MTQANVSTQPFQPKVVIELYQAGKFDQVCEHFIRVLDFFAEKPIQNLDEANLYFIDTYLKTFLFVVSQPDFIFPDPYIARFIVSNHVISNMVSLSGFKNTDAFLQMIRGQPSNLIPIMTLFSPRNTIPMNRKALFDVSAELGSLWFIQYACSFYSALASEVGWNNLKEHFNFEAPGLPVLKDVQEIYFGSTYVDGKCDRIVKGIVNKSIQKMTSALPPIRSKPNPKKIAVISATWHRTHSVYRNYSKFMECVKEKYHLTFFDFAQYTATPERSFFHESKSLAVTPEGALDLAAFQDNDFQAIIFPDVGMCAESIFLANCRLAPIQMCLPGHSVSTHGSLVDYFISGADVERPENPEGNYSERLVMIPGMGVIHNTPLYTPRGKKKIERDYVSVNCPWFAQKVNYPFLQTLKKLTMRCKKKFVLTLFAGVSSVRKNDYLPFTLELRKQLGSHVEVAPPLAYPDYMARMEDSDLSLDSFHFGGCNTVSDSLFVGVPTITWEGDKWYNRIGSQMLRLAGMHDCIATTEDEYLDLAAKMIDDEAYRADVHSRLQKVDLNSTIYSTEAAPYFVEAVDYLIENHETLKNEKERPAIRIPKKILEMCRS